MDNSQASTHVHTTRVYSPFMFNYRGGTLSSLAIPLCRGFSDVMTWRDVGLQYTMYILANKLMRTNY